MNRLALVLGMTAAYTLAACVGAAVMIPLGLTLLILGVLA